MRQLNWLIIYLFNFTFALENDVLLTEKSLPADTLQFDITELNSAETYTIQVFASVIKAAGSSSELLQSLAATVTAYTLPKSPSFLNIVSIDTNSISISWSQATIAKDAEVLEYVVAYVEMESNGTTEVSGSEKFQSSLTNTEATVSGLVQGTTYSFQVQVV